MLREKVENTLRINVDNIEKLLYAIDETNQNSFANMSYPNNFLCYFLKTGDYNCFSFKARRVMKKVNYEELLIDIKAMLVLCDNISSLDSCKESAIKICNSNYNELLHYKQTDIIEKPFELAKQYEDNLNCIIGNNLASADTLIYVFLYMTLLFLKKMNYELSVSDYSKKYIEYLNAKKISEVILLEKSNLSQKKLNKVKK